MLVEQFRSIGIIKEYAGMDFDRLVVDAQGWGDKHPVFEAIITDIRPELVIEVGSWKGASALRMLNIAKQLGLSTDFICIDTWLGSHVDLWMNEEFRKDLMLKCGYPTMFRQFIFNMIELGFIDSVFPLPMTSTAAAAMISAMKLRADVIYIDAAHDEDDVWTDLKRYYPLLRPGGVMFGDDYSVNWPGVVRAVNRFASDNALLLRSDAEKWWFAKPVSVNAPSVT